MFQDMDERAALAPDKRAGPLWRSLRRRFAKLPPRWWRFGGILLASYAIAAIFGATYGIVRLVSAGTSHSAAVIWGICAAAPLALAFIWERLSGFKVFGVEVTLAQAFVSVDPTLSTALSASEEQYFSGKEEILELIDKVLAKPDIELLEINLRTTQYWWSTRLYLQAALTEDYTKIQRLVFVDGDSKRRYIGMATPGEVRRALAQPPGVDLESAYREIQHKVQIAQRPPNQGEVHSIVDDWTRHNFSKDGQREDTIKTSMSAELLMRSVALETQWVEWDKPLDSPLLQTMVLERGVRFVPLTQKGAALLR